MPSKLGPEEDVFTVRFGGGLNTRASEDEVDEREATGGANFSLDARNSALRSREPFDLVGTAPNAQPINGFASLLKTTGEVSLLVQAGDEVYQWDGASFGPSLATVAPGTRLRGRIEHNWNLTDVVIITDIALQQPLMEWNGTTLQNIAFTDEAGSPWSGELRSRYCTIDNERMMISNIHDNGLAFPHLIVGSQREDYTIVSIVNRPASALSEEDPFFLIQPDMRYINGMIGSFENMAVSSRGGAMYVLSGVSAKDFKMTPLFPQSGADGDESLAFIGNDLMYGRQGRIESLSATLDYGDVEQNDASLPISDSIENYGNWTLTYNSRTQRVYCISQGSGEAWVLHKPLIKSNLSPWMRLTTQHFSGIQNTAIMNVYDPDNGLEHVFFGDVQGNVYRMEGFGQGDGGTTNIRTTRRSSLFSASLDATMFQLNGWIRYRATTAINVTIKLLFAGYQVFDSAISVNLPATSSFTVYGGGNYYSNSSYYSESLSARLRREKIALPSGSNEFQLEVEYDGTAKLDIQEVALRFEATT